MSQVLGAMPFPLAQHPPLLAQSDNSKSHHVAASGGPTINSSIMPRYLPSAVKQFQRLCCATMIDDTWSFHSSPIQGMSCVTMAYWPKKWVSEKIMADMPAGTL